MKAVIALMAFVGIAMSQNVPKWYPWMDYDLHQYQGPYAGQYGYNQLPAGFLGQSQTSSYLPAPVRLDEPHANEVPPMPYDNGVLPLHQLVRLPLFHEYLNIPLFKQFFPNPAFQAYLVSPLFQKYWTNPLFQQLFMDNSLFYRYIFPTFHHAQDAMELPQEMVAPGPMTKDVFRKDQKVGSKVNPESFDSSEEEAAEEDETKTKNMPPLMVFLLQAGNNIQGEYPQDEAVRNQQSLVHVPLTKVSHDDEVQRQLDTVYAEKIVRAVMSQFGSELEKEEANKEEKVFRIRPEDVKLTYDSLDTKESEETPKEPMMKQEVFPDISQIRLTEEPKDLLPPAPTEASAEVPKEIPLKAQKRFTRFPAKAVTSDINLIHITDAPTSLDAFKYNVEDENDVAPRPARETSEYKTLGEDGLNSVPVALHQNSWNAYSNGGAETPMEHLEPSQDTSFQGA